MLIRRAVFVMSCVLTPPCLVADDWPQWMGPHRDGIWSETGIVDKFPADGPRKLWSVAIAGGYSGPAVADGKVYIFDYRRSAGDLLNSPAKRGELQGSERLHCLDAATGQSVWTQEYDCPYNVSYPAGPRCTPLIQDDKVYTLGTMGNLHCRDAKTGQLLWAKDFKTDYGAEVPMWGFASHPIIYRNLLISLAGGPKALLVALDKDSGRELWTALSLPRDGAGYGTPALVPAGGTMQLVFWHPQAIVGLDPLTGTKFWEVPLKPSYGMSIMAPQRDGDTLFAGGIGYAAVALRLDPSRPAAMELWRGNKSNGIYPVNSTPLIENGVIYGVDQPGQLRAVKLATGERLWSTFKPVIGEDQDEGYTGAGSGTAFLVRNGDRYFLFAETGHLVIAKLRPEGYLEIDRARLVEPTGEAFGRKVVWSHPAYSNRCVFVRNDKEAACFSLAVR